MIITKAPLRITLAGGGTDLPDFYTKYGGSVTSMAIDKYIFVNFKRNILDNLVRLRYLKTEEVESINKLSNERARETLKHFKIFHPKIYSK
jgi:D-glycero-alpha-D-manno-heptose-7-phosphate kinase